MACTNKTAPAAGAKRHKGWPNRASRVPLADEMSAQPNCVANGHPPVPAFDAAEPDAFGSPGVALLEPLARHATGMLPASPPADSRRTDPAETLPGPERRREGLP